MKVKKWHLLVGLGGAIVISCCVIIFALVVNTYTNAIAYYCADKAEDYDDGGEYEKAVKWYDCALKLRREDWRYRFGKAEALRELGRWEEALEAYDGALALKPQPLFLEDVYVGKARALAGLGKWEEAVEAYGEAISPELPRSFEDLCDVGTALLESETYEVTVGRPFDIRPSIWDSGKYVKAIVYFKAAAKLEPQNSYPYYMEGRAWLALEQYEKAASYFDAASKLAPAYAPAWERKAWALGLMGRYEAALECADRALALDARDPRTWTSTGKILLFVGEAEAARECFDCALELKPDSPDVWILKGAAYYMLGEYDEARTVLEEHPELSPSRHTLLYLYVVDETDGGKGTERLQPLLEFPSDIWAKDVSLFLVGRISAEDLLTKAADDEARLCEAHYYIGYKRKVDGDDAGARLHLEEALATEERQCLEYALALHESRRCGFMPAASVSADKLAPPSSYASALKAGRAKAGPPGVTGSAALNSLRSSAVITHVVNERKAGIGDIYKKYLKTDPNLEGKLVVKFTVAASGAVTACSVVSSTLGNAAIDREVCDHIMTWRFPPIDAGDVTVAYPFVFFYAGAK